MAIKLAIFDVDSTLTSGVNQPVVESAVKAIKKLRENGIKVVIASGRPPYGMPSIEGQIEVDYYVGCNGQIISDGNKQTIATYQLEKDVFDEISNYCIENQLGIFWKFEDKICIYSDCELMHYVMKSLDHFYYRKHENLKVTPCGGGLICPEEKLPAFKQRFGELVDIIDGGYILYDINVKGVTKATGLQRLLEMIKVDAKECIAFGDSDNDIEMIQLAGIGIAMGNGYDSVKKVADDITDTAANDGIEKALKKYHLI